MISQWTSIWVFNKTFNFFVPPDVCSLLHFGPPSHLVLPALGGPTSWTSSSLGTHRHRCLFVAFSTQGLSPHPCCVHLVPPPLPRRCSLSTLLQRCCLMSKTKDRISSRSWLLLFRLSPSQAPACDNPQDSYPRISKETQENFRLVFQGIFSTICTSRQSENEQ